MPTQHYNRARYESNGVDSLPQAEWPSPRKRESDFIKRLYTKHLTTEARHGGLA
jgi:hypothetical protein